MKNLRNGENYIALELVDFMALELVEVKAGARAETAAATATGVGTEGQVEADMALELVEVEADMALELVEVEAGAETVGQVEADMALELVEVEAGAAAETEAGSGVGPTSNVEEQERTRNRVSKVLR